MTDASGARPTTRAIRLAPPSPPEVTVAVPGSKSITNRALVLAALASRQGSCDLVGALRSEDTEVMIAALNQLGFFISAFWDRPEPIIRIAQRDGDLIPARSADVQVANSGTTMRFLTAMLAAGDGEFRLDGVPRMRERPIGDLLAALAALGVRITCEGHAGYPPIRISARGLSGGQVRIGGSVSSQFLSALLMAAPFAAQPITLEVDGVLVSQPYVEMTLKQMAWWNLRVDRPAFERFHVIPQIPVQPPEARIEADASAASYFFAAAAITGGPITVAGYLPAGQSLQGDLAFLDVLARMGCSIERDQLVNTVLPGAALRGIDIDMNAISDTVMTLAAVACFAQGPTTIRNVAHIRHKETDRLAALASELRRLGGEVEEFDDGLRIVPRPLHGATVQTYQDHRMAMSLALIGLRVPGVVIADPGCVAKTYPGFWNDFARLESQAAG